MSLDRSQFARPAIFFINGLGDQLMALPTMRALRRLFPDQLQLMLGEGNLGFLWHDAELPPREPVRVWWDDPLQHVIDVERTLTSAEPCDLFISLATFVCPSLFELIERLQTRRSIGRFVEYSDPVLRHDLPHMFDRYFSIAQSLDPSLRIDDFAAPPTFSAPAEAAALRELGGHLGPEDKLLFLHPETADLSRRWTAERFSWVLQRFLDVHPRYKVFVSTVDPYPLELGRHRDRLVVFDEHLQLALASMRHADLFLGIDSCFLHGADLFRVPSVGLFGPTPPEQWGFRLTPNRQHVYGDGSMENVRQEAVLEALLSVAAGSPAKRRFQ